MPRLYAVKGFPLRFLCATERLDWHLYEHPLVPLALIADSIGHGSKLPLAILADCVAEFPRQLAAKLQAKAAPRCDQAARAVIEAGQCKAGDKGEE
jgi:hypothetical protein